MPVDYKNAKIYSIRSYQTDEVYIGSTCQPLSKRMVDHRSNYKCWKKDSNKNSYITSYEILQYDDAYIELIELFPCTSKEELFKQEGKHIRETENCVNKVVAGRTKGEYYVDNRDKLAAQHKNYRDTHKQERAQYLEDNKEALLEKGKIYREEHRAEIQARFADYYKTNKVALSDKHKEYYQVTKNAQIEKAKAYYHANKAKIQAHRQMKTQCEICNLEFAKANISRHTKSKAHIANVEKARE